MPLHTTCLPPFPHERGGRDETVSVQVDALPGGLRSFALRSTQPQRGGGAQERRITEQAGTPSLRCANPLLEAVFAMAVAEATQNSVEHISDAAYNGGQPIAELF